MSGGVTSSTTVSNAETGTTITISATVIIADPAPSRARLSSAIEDLTAALRTQVQRARLRGDVDTPSHEERCA
ncbi:hypothetical protein [Sphingomonas sp.]|jgi:hypothetical protein|uniref:hypothetical protein n=1 Tax=Sphingomonas sp. TaxID=28214 RepID=UPI0035C81637